jgi:lysylphosphatidylglycerol synthetase-like protein (DUF2156 family)
VLWNIFVRISGVLLFCGGPLVLIELLTDYVHIGVAFAICLAPVIGMVIGASAIKESRRSALNRGSVWLGLAAAALLLAINLFAINKLAQGPRREDSSLIVLGIVVGILLVGLYFHAARNFLRSF